MSNKITFQQLAELLSTSTGGSTSTTELFIKELFALVGKALIKGEKVQIKGIGTFMPSMDNSTIEFAPDNELAESINLPFSCFEAIELDDEMHQTLIDDDSQSEPECEIEETIEIVEPAVVKSNNHLVEDVKSVETTTEIDAGLTQEDSETSSEEENDDSQKSNMTEVDSGNDTKVQLETIAEIAEEATKAETAENQQITDSISEINETEDKSQKPKFALGLIIGFVIGLILGALAMFVIGNKWLSAQSDKPVAESEGLVDETVSVAIDSLASDTIEVQPVYQNIAVDTVKQTRFLTTMARQYYNQMLYWVYIYEENKDKLGNPNVIKPGTTVVIPDIRKYLKNDTDSVNIEHAKLKAVEIYAPYQK